MTAPTTKQQVVSARLMTTADRSPPAILDRSAVAARLGIQPNTVTDNVRRGVMPPPDVMLGRTPGWFETTIAEHEKHRRGVGRPRKTG